MWTVLVIYLLIGVGISVNEYKNTAVNLRNTRLYISFFALLPFIWGIAGVYLPLLIARAVGWCFGRLAKEFKRGHEEA